jgi:hypothetical protein
MPSALPDAFERFAVQCGLRLESEPVLAAPRDVLTPLSDADQHHLVSLRGRSGDMLQVIFITPQIASAPPRMRDVLWWLAADAWAVERSGRSIARWAGVHGYPLETDATAQLFNQHVAQAQTLSTVLGDENYRRLLALYEAEAGPVSGE